MTVIFSETQKMLFIKLSTEIDANEIRIKTFPRVKRTIIWADVTKAEVIDYGFVGGYGVRMSLKYGTVYTLKVVWSFLELKDGKN